MTSQSDKIIFVFVLALVTSVIQAVFAQSLAAVVLVSAGRLSHRDTQPSWLLGSYITYLLTRLVVQAHDLSRRP